MPQTYRPDSQADKGSSSHIILYSRTGNKKFDLVVA